ncbi:putative RNA-directed DNA polymerase, eukaryota, reverse transcriptase zinc-binding domain protein [Tanacetum coccineum]
MELIDHFLAHSLWPRNFINFAFCGSVGALGGILIMWDSRVFDMEQCFKDHNFLGVIGSWVGVSNKIGLLNVYSPQLSSSKEALWLDIKSLLNSDDITWVVFRDFNVVRNRDERFTRLDKDGRKESKLDRFMVSNRFFDTWKDVSVTVLSRSHSNHCLILLKVGGSYFRPKPFKMFNKWIGVEGFNDLVSIAWTSFSISMRPDIFLKNKLKRLRLAIKDWTNNRMVAQNLAKESLMKNLLEWDMKAKNCLINTNDILNKEEWMMDLNHLEQLHHDDLKQKGWVRWAVKAAAVDHCKEDDISRPFFSSNLFLIKEDFWNCVKLFESSCDLSNGCNPSFIVLIPKKKDPIGFSDYRPISLIGCVYKVISKLLATRLAKVINSVIGPNQSAFIEGWQILDGCLIASKIIRMAALENHKLLLFKVDFEKAFDSVNWNFLLSIITQMGFGGKWRNWISSCLSSASISVMINGSPSKEFKMEHGLRQGDPLSPLLFLIVAEALKIAIIEACNKGVFKGVSLAEIGFPIRDVEGMAFSLGCSHDSLLFIFLGLPVGKRMRFCDGWSVVIDRFRDKLSCWKAKTLSIGGRLILIKSILGRLLVYYLSLFKAPLKVNGRFNLPTNQLGSGGIWHDIINAIKSIDNIDSSFKSSFVQKFQVARILYFGKILGVEAGCVSWGLSLDFLLSRLTRIAT